MWYPPIVTVAPTSEPVTLAEAKLHLRVDGTDEDALISGLIAAARDYVDSYTGTFTAPCTAQVRCDSFADFTNAPILPLGAVTGVSYVATDGTSQILASSVYEARSDGLRASIALKAGQSWPAIQPDSRITVTATVGYATVPPSIKQAILLLIGDWYANRENSGDGMTEAPHAVSALLANYRSFGF